MTTIPDRLSSALADRYRIERELGEGGMATVYLAHDLKHDRKVALKVLKPELAAVLGAERFVVEIKTTAALQHPHILPLFDSGTADGFLYYVMPFIEGETLRSKLSRETQLGVEESIRIARDVLDALDYAHRHGVIHRDIKPENILLHDGRPVVADFGIALAVSAAAGGRMTESGFSLGTPHYMSPEQATAEKEITGRSDVYSVGSVLYEMLAGQPPHLGGTAQQIIMRIVTDEARPLVELRKSVPPNVDAAVAKALQRLPADRFASAKEFADALVNPAFTTVPTARGTTAAPIPARSTRIAALAIGVALAAVAAWGWLRPLPEPVFHVSIPAPAGTTFVLHGGRPALSPNGKTVVFAAVSDGVTRLYRRSVDGFQVDAIEGSEDGTNPFFSPDGQWVGFYSGSRELRKVPLGGGQATRLGMIPFWNSGAVWRQNGTIVVISDTRGLYVVPEHGGTLAPLAESDSVVGERQLDVPQELQDGTLLATRTTPSSDWRSRPLVALAAGASRWRVLSDTASGSYVEPGYLIARPAREMVALPFDLASGRITGNPFPVPGGVGQSFAMNWRGDVAYFAFPATQPRFLTLVDRAGNSRRLASPPGDFRHPRLSPDGTRLAVNMLGDDLWVLDLGAATWTRLTTGANVVESQWSPDGRRFAYTAFDSSTGYNPAALRDADGTGTVEIIRSGSGDSWTSDWSSDGRHLAVYGGTVGLNVFVVDMDSAHTFHPVTQGEAISRNPRFSPDGKWLAYQSNETGRMQIYVISYPDLSRKRTVSTEGGTEPVWRVRGGELFYRNGTSMMVVPIRTVPTLEVGTPRELWRGPFLEDEAGDRSYDVMPDGEHFLMFEANPAAAPELRVIRNWGAELKAQAPR